MCGVAGIFAYGAAAPPVARDELLAMREHMARRGPDGAGLWMAPGARAGLAHRRLAIIDLSEQGAQPMATADGRFHITFNGEIYNYRALRDELAGRGHRFRSGSDTEILLRLYAERGAAMLPALRGMFAFAIWDEHEQSLFLARDPFGVKPLYYADDGATLRFASQVKALVAGGAVSSRPSPAGHAGFYLWGHVPEPYTLYRAVRALPAGSALRIDRDGARAPMVYFDPARELANAPGGDAGNEALHAALRDSLAHHMVADVPVGIFLSSGIDSGLLAALASTVPGQQLHTLTLGFEEYRGTERDETPLAWAVAQRYGTRHETRWISHRDFESELPAILHAMDQPSIDGVNTYFVSRAAAACGMKVALSGVGADELFGGYPSFRDVPRMRRLARAAAWLPGAGRALRWVTSPLLTRATSPKYAGLFEHGADADGAYLLRRGLFMPWELPHLLDPDMAREGWRELRASTLALPQLSDFATVSALELTLYMRNQLLRDSDWAGMAHSLEIRVPFVDVPLFRIVAARMARAPFSKIDAAGAAHPALLEQVLQRPKTGFSVPVREWMAATGGVARQQRGLRSWACRVHAAA